MEVEPQKLKSSQMPQDVVVPNVVRRRSTASSINRASAGSENELCMSGVDDGESSLLNFAVMENACFVTKQRRSRISSSENSEGDDSLGRRKSNFCMNGVAEAITQDSRADFLMMENASTAIRKRRLRPTNDGMTTVGKQ